ncbi:MAG: hypothetical protein RL033_7048 [Pseudomonadota bacterium]
MCPQAERRETSQPARVHTAALAPTSLLRQRAAASSIPLAAGID